MSRRPAPLRAGTYLGDNTVTILDALLAHLAGDPGPGLDIATDPRAGRTSLDAVRSADRLDLVWLCGHLARRLLDRGRLRGEVVAAPVFAGEPGPVYRSVLVARRGRFDRSSYGPGPSSSPQPALVRALGGRLAVNEVESWSGHRALRRHVADNAPGRWFATEVVTGSHRASIGAVVDGTCDVAGIDSSIWRHISGTEPDLVAELEVIESTRDWPAPPLVVGADVTAAQRRAIVDGVLGFDASAVPGLERFEPADAADYNQLA